MTVGSRAGTSFLLDPVNENRIGRGTDCAIVLSDPLCARGHAVLVRENHTWRVRDAASRNGTYLDDEKIEEAVLADGSQLRVGSTQFSFRVTEQPPTIGIDPGPEMTQTVIRNQLVGTQDAESYGMASFPDSRPIQELLLLYQLSIKLLACIDPDQVVRISLELLMEWTRATAGGFLWVADDGSLKSKLLIPADAPAKALLNNSLTEMVCRQGNAVWIANKKEADGAETPDGYADALCVPLINQGVPLGAMHIYLDQGRFRQTDFDFAISLVNIASVALVRVRRDTRIQSDYQRLIDEMPDRGGIIGESPAIVELRSKIARLARATGCVLIRGESGTGKELVARALHEASSRADRPMLSVNCAAIPADLMESQLFGHRAGSFTGADRDHRGYFEQADLGTLFLDEVGELTLEGQAKLLRILEGHPFLPVGATEEVTVDVRVIAATNQDLQTYVRTRKFREDLYYRLTVFELQVPPLRERGGDINLLIDFFLEHFNRQHGRRLDFSQAARDRLVAYSWPGNVRQLRNVVDSAVVLAEGHQIELGDLPLRDAGGNELESLQLDYWERRLIAEALRRSNDNVPEAARLLGLGRATLYRKIEQYGIAR